MTSGSPRRRILLVVNGMGPGGGAETQLEYLAIGLSEAGHSVAVLAIEGIACDIRSMETAGVEIVSLLARGPISKLLSVPAIARHARRAEVVHCTGWDATLWGRLSAFLARRPMLITEHTPGRHLQVTEAGASRARAIALHNRILDRVTFATIAVARWQFELLESEGVRPDSIVHIPNAVPVADLRRRAELGPTREELGIPEEALVIVHVARFMSQKGQEKTLQAGARLRGALGDVRVLFAGSGRTEEKVKREAAEMDADWAIFLGNRTDVPGLLRLADLAVLPSSGEGLPMALIEAIVLGTPVVATDVGDVRWLLERTKGGICVQPEDESGFLEACGQMLGDADLRQRFSAAAKRASEEFDEPKMTSRYEQIFQAAIASRPLPQFIEQPSAD